MEREETRRLDVHVPSHEDDSMAEVMAARLGVQLARFEEWGLPRVGLLILMSACQGRCFFCASPAVTAPGPEIVTPNARVERWLEENLRLGVEELCIGGTEPPTHAFFEKTLARAQRVGFRRIQIMTSALVLEDPKVARAWHEAGVRSIVTPLYAADAETHDAVVGVAGHLERVSRGLDQARKAGIEPHLHTLALRRTLDRIPALGRFVRERWQTRLAVAPLRAKDELFEYASEAVTYPELERALAGADVSLVGFPSCVAPEIPRRAGLLIELYFRAQRTVFDAACDACSARPSCPGLVAAHHAARGAEGLRPR